MNSSFLFDDNRVDVLVCPTIEQNETLHVGQFRPDPGTMLLFNGGVTMVTMVDVTSRICKQTEGKSSVLQSEIV